MINIRSGMRAYYQIAKIKADEQGEAIPDTREIVADWFPNLITDFGRNHVGSDTSSFSYCRVGTGNTTPTFADTALETQIASTNDTATWSKAVSPTAPYYTETVITKRFASGAVVGNVAEVGMGDTAAGGDLFSRALILDSGGNPATISVLADEILEVTYRIQFIPNVTDVVGIISISGTDYNYTLRPANVLSTSTNGWGGFSPTGLDVRLAAANWQRAYNGNIQSVTQLPSGAGDDPGTAVTNAYVNNSYSRSGTLTWGLSVGNLAGGIRSVAVAFGCGTFQIEFDPVLAKDASKILSLEFYHSWDRDTI